MLSPPPKAGETRAGLREGPKAKMGLYNGRQENMAPKEADLYIWLRYSLGVMRKILWNCLEK